MTILLVLQIICMISYLLAASLQGMIVSGYLRSLNKSWRILSWATLILHAIILYRLIDFHPGQNLSAVNVFSLIVWLIAIFLNVMVFWNPLENLCIIVYPLVALSILGLMIFPKPEFKNMTFKFATLLHVWVAVFAVAALSLAAIQAILLGLQERSLKSRRFGTWLHVLPPLETMESLLYRLIVLGFILLSLLIISSILVFKNVWSPPLLPQILLCLMAWLIFAILLWGRYCFGWRGRVATRWTLSGVLILMIAYFGTILFANDF